GHFTLGNASNNGLFMLHLKLLLEDINVLSFDDKKNYIRYFTHVINLCSQANIGKFLWPGLAIAEKYYNKMVDTDAYIIAMYEPLFFSSSFTEVNKHGWLLDGWCLNSQAVLHSSVFSVQNHGRTTWPKIFCLFADYAPIQATSVPSEQVFSSSAETDTKQWNRTNALLM
ncbi:hypothetical protein B0H17DRAFT_911676, partial [Mycena rosella]